MTYKRTSTLFIPLEITDVYTKFIEVNENYASILHRDYAALIEGIMHGRPLDWSNRNIHTIDKETVDYTKPLGTEPSNSWGRGVAHVRLKVSEGFIEKEVKRMESAYRARPKQTSARMSYKPAWVSQDMKDYNGKYIIRGAINDALLKSSKLRFDGHAIYNLIKKPKKQEQTPVDIERETIFYEVFDRRLGWYPQPSITNSAIFAMCVAIARSENILLDDIKPHMLRKFITTRCLNENIYAKLAGSEDICELVAIEPARVTGMMSSVRTELSRQIFVDNCSIEDSGKIFDDIVKEINNTIGHKPSHREGLIRKIGSAFQKHAESLKNKQDSSD